MPDDKDNIKEQQKNENLGMREREVEPEFAEQEDLEILTEEENEESLDESFEDYQSEEDYAKEDGVFNKKDKTVDERAKSAYRSSINDFSDAKVMDKDEYDKYVKGGKKNGEKIVVNDNRFSLGTDYGFTEAEQFKFGWRSSDSKAKIVIKDKILPQFDPEHKTLSVLKMIALPVTLPVRGVWAGLKAIGRGFFAVGKFIGQSLGIVKENNPFKIELIGEKLEYEDSDRTPGVLTTEMKKNKVTPDMVYKSVISHASLENINGDKKLGVSLIDGTAKENYANSLKEKRNDLLAHVFGKGNPLAAYDCVLDKKAAKNGVYKFDDKAVNNFLKELSDEKLENYANKCINGVKKNFFKQFGGEQRYIEEKMEKPELKNEIKSEEKAVENVSIKKEPVEVVEAKENEIAEENVKEEVKEESKKLEVINQAELSAKK